MAKQKIKGLSGSLKDNSLTLIDNQKNTRILFGYPITHLAHLYELGDHGVVFGPNIERKKLRLADRQEIYGYRIERASSEEKKEQLRKRIAEITKRKEEKIERKKDASQVVIIPGYSKEKARAKKKKVEEKFDRRIARQSKEKRIKKLRERKANKLDKRDRKIKQGNQLMRWGEPLAIYDHNKARVSADEIRQYLNSKGFFNAEVTIDTANYDSLNGIGKFGRDIRNWVSRWAGAKHRYINLDYNVKRNQHYFIDSIQYQIEDPELKALVLENNEEAPLKKDFYDQKNLSAERDFIYDLAVNNGYYEFSKQYISFQIDSTQLGKDTLIVREVIRNPVGQDEHEVFYLDSIVFISDASVDHTYTRTMEKYQDVTFSFGRNIYSKKILSWRIPLQQDDRYSRDMTIETQRQLSFLDNFKFINIKYDTLDNLFIANIFTSPFDKYSTSSEFGLSSTQGRPGPFFNVNLKNRNTFRAMEIISLDINAKLQDLRNVSNIETDQIEGNYTSRQFGGEASILFPQFLFPLGSYYKKQIGRYNPQTRMSFGVSFEDRVSEYTRLTYRGTFGYSWQVRDRIKYTVTPAQISWIDSKNSASFQEFLNNLIAEGNTYANAFNSAVVSSASFTREENIGDYGLGQEGGFIRLYLESGGYLNDLISGSFFGDELETFNYAKANVDLRKIERLSRKYNLAFRLNLGYAYPYGDNRALPYEKYFFAGGSSSIRGWKPRRLGPGSFAIFEEEDGVVNYDQEQPGEILIETSLELRRDLVGFLEGAIFLDAGNVWLQDNRSSNAELDKGVFAFDRFMTEMAVATGMGFRFDLQFLIFRVDLGMKLFDPAQPKGERFVGDQIFKNFGPNTELNIGIGYPF
ncbi:MAG: BamA/TamA family outer membrane protein [Ekhidna sp.]